MSPKVTKKDEIDLDEVKKKTKTKIFISHRNAQFSNQQADKIQKRLDAIDEYGCFLDRVNLESGDLWESKIYDELRDSDVLLILMEKGTASEWVKREVNSARGANISILPVVLTAPNEDISDVQSALGIDDRQYIRYTEDDAAKEGSKLFETLVKRIEALTKLTRDNQKSWMKQLEYRRRITKAKDQESYKVYPVGGTKFRIHIATGDITKLKNIDVLVNSENDYMQMARIYERATISSALRREGSYIFKGRLRADTVQDELDDQIRYSDLGGLPIVMEQVIPTTAGHPQSVLRLNNKARYIFHAATVRVDVTSRDETLVPIRTDDGIQRAVQNCLNMISEIDKQKGIIWSEGNPRYTEQLADAEKYEKIKSIIFPIFGAGHAGRSAFDVIEPMAIAFRDFVQSNKDNTELALTDIYLCVFSETELGFAVRTFEEVFSESRDGSELQ
jgi:O-acetyl-ADP-ribose deacetylase (regulator of RNase III)